MTIATSYSIEKVIIVPIAKTIIDKIFVPKYKDSIYFESVNNGIDSIITKWK